MNLYDLIRIVVLICVNFKTISCQIDINCDVNWDDSINCDTGEYFNIADEFRTISSVQPNDQKNFTRFQTYYLQTTYVPENVFFDITFEEIDFYQTDVLYFIDRNAFRSTFNITRRLLFSQTTNLRSVPPGTDLYAAISSLVNLESVTIDLATDYVHVIPENAFSSLNGPLNSLEEIIFRGDFSISNIANNAFANIPNLKTWFIFSSVPIGYIASQAFDFTQPSVDRLEIHLNGSSLNESSFGDNVFSGSQRPLFVDLDNNNIVNFRENTFSAFFNASPLNNISIANNPLDCDNSDIGWLLSRYVDLVNRLLNAQCSNGSLLWDLIGTTPTPSPSSSTTPISTLNPPSPTPSSSPTPPSSPNPPPIIDINCDVNWPDSINCDTGEYFNIADEFRSISSVQPNGQKNFTRFQTYYLQTTYVPENVFFDITFEEIQFYQTNVLYFIDRNAFRGTFNITRRLLFSQTSNLRSVPPGTDLYAAISSLVNLQSVTIDLATDYVHVIPENAFSSLNGPLNSLEEIIFRGDFSISNIANNAFANIPNLKTWFIFSSVPIGYISSQAFDFTQPSVDRLEIHLNGSSLNESSFGDNVFSGSQRPLFVDLDNNNIVNFRENTFSAFFNASPLNNISIANNPLDCDNSDIGWLLSRYVDLVNRLLNAQCSNGSLLWDLIGTTPTPLPSSSTTPISTLAPSSPTPSSSPTPPPVSTPSSSPTPPPVSTPSSSPTPPPVSTPSSSPTPPPVSTPSSSPTPPPLTTPSSSPTPPPLTTPSSSPTPPPLTTPSSSPTSPTVITIPTSTSSSITSSSTSSPNPGYCTVSWPQSIVCNTDQNFDIRAEFQRISNSLPANQKTFNQLLIYYVPIAELVANAFFDITFNEIDLHEMQNMTAVNTNAFNGTANTTTRLLLSETNALINSPPNDDLYLAISAIVSLQSVTIDLAAGVSHVIPENAFRVVSAPQTALQEIIFRGDFSISQISNNAFAAIPNLRTWIQMNNLPVQYVARQAFDFSQPSTDRLEIHLEGCGLNESSFDNNVFSGSQRPLYVNLNDNQIRYLNESTFSAFFDANAGNNLTIADNPLECSDLNPFEWLFNQRPQLESRLLSALCSDGTPLWNYAPTQFPPTGTTPVANQTTPTNTPVTTPVTTPLTTPMTTQPGNTPVTTPITTPLTSPQTTTAFAFNSESLNLVLYTMSCIVLLTFNYFNI